MLSPKPTKILKILQDAGYEAWYVGGCVRDTLLGRPIHDWDITTSATPEEIMACFPRCVPTGIRHGTITVFADGASAEVTTYRSDGIYLDGRHPDCVRFVTSLNEDLARRDFTINAMAMDDDGRIVDLYGGMDDLHQGVLRCVGDPLRRFEEDALRMLRAIRFSAQLGFAICESTADAIQALRERCRFLSAERIRDEVEKTILSAHPENVMHLAELGLPTILGLYGGADAAWLANLPQDRTVRWAALCRCYPKLDLRAMRLDKQTARDAMAAGRMTVPTDRLGWKLVIAEQGRTQASILAALTDKIELLEEICASGECLSLKELAVNGSDFPELEGKALGEHLRRLLYHVLVNPNENDSQILKNFSENF